MTAQRIAIDRAVVSGPVAAAVMVKPADIVERDALQLARGPEALRPIRHQALDNALAGLFVIGLVARYREEAFANRIFLVHFPRMDRCAREHRRPRRIEIGKQRPPVHDRDFFIIAPRFGRKLVPVDIRGIVALSLRALVDFRELGRVASPFHWKDIRLCHRRRLDQAAFGNFEFAHGTHAPVVNPKIHQSLASLTRCACACQSHYDAPAPNVRRTMQ